MSSLDIVLAAAGSASPPPGQIAYTTAGTYSWVCPAGVTSVSVVCVGGGGSYGNGGAGGGLGYKNNITVVPGNSYTVVVGAGGVSDQSGGDSYFINASTVKGGGAQSGTAYFTSIGGSYTGDGGGLGGSVNGGFKSGAGAGGYSGKGGDGGANYVSGNYISNPGNGGAGGSGAYAPVVNSNVTGAAGGGVGLLGQGSSGGSATGILYTSAEGGKGGSGGTDGSTIYPSTNPSTITPGLYGGGGAYTDSYSGNGGGGAVRIIWPGTTRQFPSTNTQNQ